MKLKKRETEFFQYMVMYNQARNHEEKKKYFEKMLSFKESSVAILDANQYEFYDKWYHGVIRALLEFIDFRDEYAKLGKTVTPCVSADEVEKSISLMEKLKLIKKDAGGFFRPADNIVDSGPAPQAVSINNMALQALKLGQESIDRFKGKERMHTGMTLGVSQKGYDALVQELRDFRKRVYKIVEKDAADRVVQVNIQVFPVSKTSKD